ncbi:activated protein kinase catalytic subunit alpha-1 [Seminavis robusta]|uniref:cGMP-dependent protein kinase n=1 Tax=Seminavis robusta TaxID=568900 RepID=A0A9N8ED61_9STRA|nr:activated protein kinase catalytic subunit alpha-1 [Seminavis robusta]|eukprot:Sro976_g226970.1 activated protein kinase catalytic subunit alpha-1 (854) ;mRNA; r:25393-28122
MGCGSSKPEDVAMGGDPSERSFRSGRFGLDPQLSSRIIQGTKEVVGGAVNAVNDVVIKPTMHATEKVASLAIALPTTLGQGIKTQAHHLRNVFAAPLAADDLKGFTLPVYSKTEEERKFILKTLSESFIFANLEKRELSSIIDAFEKAEFKDQAEILKQGDEAADFFYLIYKGGVTYHVDGEEVGSSEAGSSFGELSLLYRSPRAATVKAKGECVTFRVDQKSFRSVLQKKNMQSAEQKLELLKKVSFLYDMEVFDLQKLSSAMTPVNFEPKDVLVKKGEAGDAFFLIQEGEVKVTDIEVGESKFEDATLGEGDYFGERALITSEPRAANVVAVSKGVAMKIDKKTFELVLGNLSSLIVKSQDKRLLAGIKVVHDTYLEPAILDAMAGGIADRKFPKGTVLTTEGEDTEAAIYLVRSGKIAIQSKDGTKDVHAGKGTFFGEDTLSNDRQYANRGNKTDDLEASVDMSSEYVMSKPTTTKAHYTAVVEEDAVCGVLTLKSCRTLFDTTRLGRGKGPLEMTASIVEKKAQLSDLKKHVMLGTGTFGQVWLVSLKGDDDKVDVYALKIQSKTELIQAHQAKGVVQEMTIMKQLNHPLLLRLVKTFQDEQFVYMMLGLVQGGELFNRIHSPIFDGVPESTAKFYAAGVYEGLAYMHRRQIIYRDLKPENVLIDTKGYPVIVDFGFAKKIVDKTYTFCGTPLYIAPEVILNRGHNAAADIWSLGVLINEMITGDTPFYKEGMDQLDLYRQICSAKFEAHPILQGKTQAIDIINKLLSKVPSQRLGQLKGGQKDIFGHPWFSDIAFEQYRAREVKAPWIPKIKDPLDSSNFDSWKHMKDKTKQKWPPLDAQKQAIFAGF